jgi:hypothetical protein
MYLKEESGHSRKSALRLHEFVWNLLEASSERQVPSRPCVGKPLVGIWDLNLRNFV